MFVCHSGKVIKIARQYGWLPGARYTNLRDIRAEAAIGFLDIDWKNYTFEQHLYAASKVRPSLTVARDIERMDDLDAVLKQAEQLGKFCNDVAIVPKAKELEGRISEFIPSSYMLAYSVPTRYGGTTLSPASFAGRRVHLLGGRPDVQRRLAAQMQVVSIDTNRFTLDARFGDYFDGLRFRPHPIGGYERCIEDSIRNITGLWQDYRS